MCIRVLQWNITSKIFFYSYILTFIYIYLYTGSVSLENIFTLIYIGREKDIYYKELIYYAKELAHEIMEAKKTQNLPPANWRPRKVCGVIQSESKCLKTSWWSKSQSNGQRRCDQVTSAGRKQEGQTPPSSSSGTIQAFSALNDDHSHLGEGGSDILYWVHGFKCWSHPETPSNRNHD